MSVATLAMAVFFILYALAAFAVLPVPNILLGVAAAVAGIALLVGK